MSGRTKSETWNGFKDFPMVGRSFELLGTQSPVDVRILRGSEVLEQWDDVEAGTKYTVPDNADSFSIIEITTPANETVKFAVTDGITQYDPRAQWFDRNPITRPFGFYSGGTAPHVDVQRYTYTVPTGKKAMIEQLLARSLRITAAAAPGKVGVYHAVNLVSDGIARTLITATMLKNNVGDDAIAQNGGTVLLCAGDILSGRTADEGTGGTVDVELRVKVTEFNA